MALDREAIYQALFDRLSGVQGIVLAQRIWRSYDDVPPAEQPFLSLTTGQETPVNRRGLPPVWKLDADVVVYCCGADVPHEPPSVQLHRLLMAVESSLERTAEEEERLKAASDWETIENCYGTTLGGLCSHCWISGPVTLAEGKIETGSQAIAHIPIEILSV